MHTLHISTALFLAALLAPPSVANAQTQSGAIANVNIAAAAGDGTEGIAISGGVGYRFNRSIGFGIELTHLPSLESEFHRLYGGRFGGFDDDDDEGNATIFTTNVRVEIPTTMRRILPYVTGGGGVASVTEAYSVIYALPAIEATSSSLSAIFPVPYPGILPGPSVIQNTTVAMALTLGGGASVLLTDHLSVDIDVRAFRFVSDTGRTMGRFGVGASYRF